MDVKKFWKRFGLTALTLLVISLIIRAVIEIKPDLTTGPSAALLEWGTSVFDKGFDVATGQTEAFQTESQLVLGAALVSGVVKALESAGTDSRPVWVAARRVFAIFFASGLTIGFLLAFAGSLISLIALAVGEEMLVESVIWKTALAWSVTLPGWFIARRIMTVLTVKGLRLPPPSVRFAEEAKARLAHPIENLDLAKPVAAAATLAHLNPADKPKAAETEPVEESRIPG